VVIEAIDRDCSLRFHSTLAFTTHLGPGDRYLVITPWPIHMVLPFPIAIGSMYLGDPVEGRHRLIKQRNTNCFIHCSWYHAHLPSVHRSTQLLWLLKHSCRAFIDPRNFHCSSRNLADPSTIHAICVVPHTLVANDIFSTSSYVPRARTALSHEHHTSCSIQFSD
jgi:hypothetical protein